MNLRTSLTACLLTLTLFVLGCQSSANSIPPSEPTTAPATPAATSKATAQDTAASTSFAAERYRLVNEPGEIVSVLQNGMTVIAKRVPSPAVSVRGYVYTGGVYEGRWLGGGLSHLLEHLVAGGSTKRRTEAENRNLLQAIGNNSNAYTTYDHTAYFINTTPEHVDKAVDLLTGWLFGALITPDEYAREYEVVQRELEKGKGEPDRQFYYLSAMNRYRVHPARVPVIGYQEVIRGLSRDDVYEYYRLTYQPNNMVFSIAGDLEPQAMLSAVQKYVADAGPGREFSRDVPPEPPVVAPRTLVATFPKLGQAKLELAFPTIPLNHPDLFALDLLAAVLGQGESSRLVEELRDKRRLVSSIYAGSYTPDFADGSFEIQMELDPERIGEASDAVLQQLAAVAKDGVSKDRVERAKVQVRTARVKGQQTAEEIASSLATDFMSTGDPHFSDRYVRAIQDVTSEQVQAMAKKYFDRRKLLTSTLLPAEFVGTEGLPKAEDLIRSVAPTTAPTVERATQVTRVELPNGTVLLHKRITTTPLVAVRMYSLGGLTVEDAKTNGLGNLTMEMLPRGTKTRSAQQIASFFDSIGGDLETGCGNNSWFWNAQFLKDDFDKAFEVYADVVNNPAFPGDELEPVRKRTLAAIASQDADWFQQAQRFFKRVYFGPSNSPYQFLPIGTAETVQTFTADQMRQWYGDKVTKAPRVLAIFGDVELERARDVAQRYLGGGERVGAIAKRSVASKVAPGRDKPAVEVRAVEVNETQQPLAGVVVGFDAQSVIGDPANYPIAVADTMVSGYGYPTGYLHEILRGRGLVYVVHAVNSPGRSEELPGTFIVYAGCDPSKVNEVIDVILENVARLQGTPADMQADWFERSKQLAVTSDALDNERASDQANTAALDELYGLGYDHHEQFDERVNAVTIDDVRAVSAGRLSRCVITVSTPDPKAVEVKPGTRTYQSFPPVDLTPKGVEHDTAGP